jgi:prepilin-type processing-associated H-X9-DG protein
VTRELIIPNPKLKLLDQVREVMRLRHYSIRTEQCYCDWIRRYINMGRFTISRHGGVRPASAPRRLTNGAKLPGGINVSFADGHSGLIRLEQPWELDWHLDWQTPAIRPQNPR